MRRKVLNVVQDFAGRMNTFPAVNPAEKGHSLLGEFSQHAGRDKAAESRRSVVEEFLPYPVQIFHSDVEMHRSIWKSDKVAALLRRVNSNDRRVLMQRRVRRK